MINLGKCGSDSLDSLLLGVECGHCSLDSLMVSWALGYFVQGSRLIHDCPFYIMYFFSSSEICTPRLVGGHLCMVHGDDVKHLHMKNEET